MKFVLIATAAALLAGCSVHSKSTIASVRASGVSERTVEKLQHHGILAPGDLIELKQHGVNEAVPIRQLDRVGVDYVVQRDDLRRLRSAGVPSTVADALIHASDRFLADRYVPGGYYSAAYPYPYHYGGPWWIPDVTLGYSWGWGGCWGHHGHCH